eukprot:381946-Prorocentrum_minimum.AAC.1
MDYSEYMVAVARGGVVPLATGAFSPPAEGRLIIEDPQEAGSDIGRGSFQMGRVREAFAEAYAALSGDLRPSSSDEVASSSQSRGSTKAQRQTPRRGLGLARGGGAGEAARGGD